MAYPRVLVISNNCFSSIGSNGRTLQDLFSGWPISNLAQFFIWPESPDSPVCNKYFLVTDREALRSVWSRSAPVGRSIAVDSGESGVSTAGQSGRRIRKTPTTSLARHAVWSLGSWRHRGFMSWVEAFDPHVVFLLAGDAPFLFALAHRLSLTLGIPLVIMSTEDYYFKTRNYMPDSRSSLLSSLMFRAFMRILRRQARLAFAVASIGVFNSDGLRRLHEDAYGVRGVTVMPPATLKPGVETGRSPDLTFAYLGNLGHGRHVSIIELGAALQRLNPELHLDVYGRTPSENVLSDLQNSPGIRYKGVVPYDEVVSIMHRAHVLVHAESFLERHRSQIKYAFSTKLADYMASGACPLIYAPPELWLTRYLRETGAAVVVSDPNDLERTLDRLISSEAERSRYAKQALMVAARSHSFEGNIDRFQAVLREVVSG